MRPCFKHVNYRFLDHFYLPVHPLPPRGVLYCNLSPQMCWEYQVTALIWFLYHQTSCNQELGGSKIFSLSVCRTMPSHRDSNPSNSHSDNPAPHSLTFNTMLNYAFNKHIIVNGTVQIFMVMFVRWRQIIHPTANSFHCQHCRGVMLRRKLREGTSHPQNLLYLKSFPKLFGTSKPRGAFCNKLGRDCLKCWNKRCLLNLTIFMLLAAPSTV